MVDEISTRIITVPMCLRPHGSQGFIPASWFFTIIIWIYRVPHLLTSSCASYFERIGITRDQERIQRAIHAILHGVLTVTHAQLRSFPCDITLPMYLPDQEHDERVMLRQQKLAVTFREFMTRDQSFRTANSNRQELYTRVISAANTVNFLLLHHFCDPNIFFSSLTNAANLLLSRQK